MNLKYKLLGGLVFTIFLVSCGNNSVSSSIISSSSIGSSTTPSSSVINSEIDENAPKYEGMEFLTTSTQTSPIFDNPLLGQKTNTRFSSNESSIDEILVESNPNPMDYYGLPNSETLVHIYIQNPLKFEILSFTLNEDKFQSFQFQDGSNSDLLILKINLPSFPGRYDYTIDQIKYVDGTEIKDVRIDGDQTVKVGVTYVSKPTLSAQPLQINKHTISTSINVTDALNQFGDDQSKLKFILINQDALYYEKDLNIGNQNILVDKLPAGENFTLYIVGLFDSLDGEGYQQHVYQRTDLRTLSFVGFSDVTITTNSISFKVTEDDPTNVGSINKIEIIEGDELVEEIQSPSPTLTSVFSELFSNTTYTIKVHYLYQIQGVSGQQVLIEEYSFSTDSYQTPELSFGHIFSTTTSISFSLDMIDIDQVGALQKVEVFENTTLINTITNQSINVFNNLKNNTIYTLKATYEYDLADGNGTQYLIITQSTSTISSPISIQSGSVLLASGSTVPNVGEEIQLRFNLSNSDNKTVSAVIMNGVEYPVITPNSTIISIKFIPDTFGGIFDISVTGLVYSHNGLVIIQGLTTPYQNSLNVLGGLDITNFMMADGKDYVNIRVTNEELAIEIDNPFGYKIYEVVIIYDRTEIKYSSTQILMFDNSTIFLDWRGPEGAQIYVGEWYSKITVKSITYGTSSDKTKNQQYDDVFKYFYFVTSDTVQNINTPSDLVNIQSGRYTSINADLDLSAFGKWIPKDFTGIIKGNGHKISNLSIFETNNNSGTQTFGLFKNFVGKIDGLIIDYASVDISTISNVNVGFLAGSSTSSAGMEINEVRILNSIMVVNTQGVANIGAFGGGLGFGQDSYLDNVSIKLVSSSTNTTLTSYVGGFFKEVFYSKDSQQNIIHAGNLLNSYSNRLSIDIASATPVVTGGFVSLSNAQSKFENLFVSNFTFKAMTGNSNLTFDTFANQSNRKINVYVGSSSTFQINSSDILNAIGNNVVNDDLFKSSFIYDTLNWNPLIWTFRGKTSNLHPFLIEPYTLTFFSNGGTLINSITQDYLTDVNQPTTPIRNGYTFDGWFLESTFDTEFDFEFMPFEGANLFAKWNINTYFITYNLNNGENNEANQLDFTVETNTFSVLDPSRRGYTFAGWYTNSSLTGSVFNTITQGTYQDITLYAKWSINTYTISYELNGGVNGNNPVTYTVETATITIADATRVGYTFDGWYGSEDFSGEAVTTIALGSVGNVTLHAKWLINEYTISFDSNEGSEVSAITQNYATDVVAPSEPTRSGYTFVGWFSDEAMTTAYVFSTMAAEDITLYAKWNSISSEE